MHLLSLALYSLLVGALFSVFMREGVKPRIGFALRTALAMVGIAVALGWVMFFVG